MKKMKRQKNLNTNQGRWRRRRRRRRRRRWRRRRRRRWRRRRGRGRRRRKRGRGGGRRRRSADQGGFEPPETAVSVMTTLSRQRRTHRATGPDASASHAHMATLWPGTLSGWCCIHYGAHPASFQGRWGVLGLSSMWLHCILNTRLN